MPSTTVTSQDGCMLWQGPKTTRGYPVIGINYKLYYVHRIIAFYFRVKHPDWRRLLLKQQYKVMHTCDTSPCINPDHLQIDFQFVNVWDSIFKGRRLTILKPT